MTLAWFTIFLFRRGWCYNHRLTIVGVQLRFGAMASTTVNINGISSLFRILNPFLLIVVDEDPDDDVLPFFFISVVVTQAKPSALIILLKKRSFFLHGLLVLKLNNFQTAAGKYLSVYLPGLSLLFFSRWSL